MSRGASGITRFSASEVLILLLAAAVPAARAQPTRPADQRAFFGTWKLDGVRSESTHGEDLGAPQWRSYAQDGERVKVSWGVGSGAEGSYSVRCDGTLERGSGSSIRCWKTGPETIDGEQLDDHDPVHRYYRRVVSHDRKTLSLLWYKVAKRRHLLDRLVYTKG